ncbi:MAG: 30S ribosomal protein S17e [Desulfurococcales archaeon]|nr:30S ribosomal protein S17e [Desulfurococcales archaeon]MEB3757436.1 30S ribosomal protein S17e [Desulfurococcales archaeon]MEB3758969.1 30S ribosomal protein S17e [Desulfurococcales archaeon]MEB3772392.1 30S ribosomal protein S17e [Desulfurococcales archaeon]MEB3786679.1 30S ribosomal protein S17e [Desulfurococcales archaeon]
MGKVRPTVVKRTARKLLTKYPDIFTDSFEENKKIVDQLIEYQSKRVRNRIAGYITHLVKILKKKEQ